MARPLRIQYPGAVYHVTSRGNARKAIFKDDKDRLIFLKTLLNVNQRYEWICHAYCLMDNHYHLVIETTRGNLSFGMRQLNGVYTQSYNRRHHKVGHIFQGRFKAILVEKDSYLLELSRYVVLNPVRAGMVDRPSKWKWSSYGGTAGLVKPPGCLTTDWLLEQFGRRKKEAWRRYRQFVYEGVGAKSVWKEIKGQTILGGEGFIKTITAHLESTRLVREIPRRQRHLARPGLSEIFTHQVRGDKEARDRMMREAVTFHGYTQSEVAVYLGMHYSTVSRLINH